MNFGHESIFCNKIGRSDRYIPIYVVFRYWDKQAFRITTYRFKIMIMKDFSVWGVWNEIRSRRGVQRVSPKCVEDDYCLLAENEERIVAKMFQCRTTAYYSSRRSVVRTRVRAERSGARIPVGAGDFSKTTTPALVPTQHPFQLVSGFFPRRKAAGA
jgi:hypothetical protein